MKKLLLLISIMLAGVAAAQAVDSPVPNISAPGDISSEQIEAAIQSVNARDGLDEETRAEVITLLRDAQSQIDYRLAANAAAAAFADVLDTAPAETRRLQETLEQPAPEKPTADSFGIRDDTALDQIEQTLGRELASLAASEARLAELESQLEGEAGRPAVARERITALRGTREALSALIASAPPPGEPAILSDARRLSTTLMRDARSAELAQFEQELLSNSARVDLLRARRDVAQRETTELRRRVEFLQQIVNDRRQTSIAEVEAGAIEAERAATDKHPVIRALAEDNASIARRLPSVAEAIERETRKLADMEREAQDIEQNLARSRQRLEIGGVNQAIGRLLLDERRNLPRHSQYRSDVRARRQTLSEIGLEQFRIEELRSELAAFDDVVNDAMREVSADVENEQQLASIRDEAIRLLQARRELLENAGNTYRSYLRVLADLDSTQKRLVESAAEFRHFLDRNLIWIPSTSVIGLATISNLRDALQWAFSPASWVESTGAAVRSMRTYFTETVFGFLLLGAALISRRPLMKKFKTLNEKIGRLSSDNIGLTFAALAISAVLSLPIPLALAIPGIALQQAPNPTIFDTALSTAFLAVASFLYNLLLLQTVCATNGVAHIHFSLLKQGLDTTRKELRKLIFIGTPVVFVFVLSFVQPNAAYRESLARLAFVALMLLFVAAAHSLGDPRKGVAKSYYDAKPGTLLSRFRWFWYSLGIGTPVALAFLAIIGFLYTAAVLTGVLIDTTWLILGLALAHLLVLRWLGLARSKIELQIALESHSAPEAAPHSEGLPEGDSEIPVVEHKPLDMEAVDQQTRRLLRFGLLLVGALFGWAIWSDLLPALRILEDVSLWSQTETVDGVATIVPVTLADLLLALLIAAATAIGSKNLPGLMEVAVLQRLDLDAGSHYTINTLLRYLVVTIGVIAVFSIVGWNWSRIQWLVAALSVGLGFGLQEIVANFVSGLIILFERPVRVGDTVTVGELTGTVSKVRIRATTITDWDRKEIIVPNKNFITEQVVNWTLTDPITRIVVPVGISYNSDVHLATRIMEETLTAMPLVLDDPAPRVYFVGFGDSSLDFNLYVYSQQLSDRMPLKHAVHDEIWAALQKNGIEIPFPQRDLYVKSLNLDDANLPGGNKPEDES